MDLERLPRGQQCSSECVKEKGEEVKEDKYATLLRSSQKSLCENTYAPCLMSMSMSTHRFVEPCASVQSYLSSCGM
ncbi:hypothetical protein M406DRAFT_54153, partial [Cryphonectria parasitica EP155]